MLGSPLRAVQGNASAGRGARALRRGPPRSSLQASSAAAGTDSRPRRSRTDARTARSTACKVDAVAYYLPGRTALGVPVGKGVVAVDPKLIPLGTQAARPGLRPGPRGRRRRRDQGPDHRPLVPEHGQGAQVGPPHRDDHGLPLARRRRRRRSPATQSCHACDARRRILAGLVVAPSAGRVGADVRSTGRPSRASRPARDRARSRARDAGRRSAADGGARGRPADRDRSSSSATPSLSLAPGVRREARRRVRRAARARARLPVPHRGRSAAASSDGRVWDGDLYLVGYGDPTLTRRGPRTRSLATFAATGIRRVDGPRARRRARTSTRDETRSGLEAVVPRHRVATAVGALRRGLSLRRSERLGRRSGVGVHGGARATRRRRGGRAGAGPRSGATRSRSRSTSRSRSSTILRHMNRESDNFVAEMLLKELGATSARRGSTRAGRRVVRATLAMPACRSTACASPTARGSRASTASPRGRSSASSVPARATRRSATSSSPRSPSPASPERSRTGSATRPTRGPRHREDRDDEPRIRPRRLRPAPLRLRDPPERLARPVLDGARRAGSLRHRASALVAAREDRPPRGRARRASRPSGAFEPGLSPTMTPVVFFETELRDLRAERLERRLRLLARPALERPGDHVLAAR